MPAEDKAIGDLEQAVELYDEDLFVVEQDDTAKSVSGALLKKYASIKINRTASGNPATFDDGGDDLPIVSLVATISPIQSGSGEPSPTNVRPISGTEQVTFGVNDNEFSAPLGQTVYGGTLDVTNGVLTVNMAMVDLRTLDWWLDGSRFKAVIPNGIVTGQFGPGAKAICSAYPYHNIPTTQPDKTFTFSSSYDSDVYAIAAIKDSSYTDVATFKTAMSGVQFVYKLATPLTYQLTPHEANTVLGANTIYTGSGFPVTVTYRADPGTVIEDIIDAITSLGGNV